MKMSLEEFAKANGIPIFHMNPTNEVICDVCGKRWTDSDVSGGFLFGSYGYCPDCAEEGLKNIEKYNEQHLIKGFCPPEMSHANWIRDIVRKGLL